MSVALAEAPHRSYSEADHATAADLVRAATRSERGAWTALVARFDGLVRGTARSYGLRNDDVADISQAVWLRLIGHLNDVREPERIAGWLSTTTRHECLRLLRQQGCSIPTCDSAILDTDDQTSEPGTELAVRQRNDALTQVIRTLPLRYRSMLRVMMAEPAPSYREAATTLGIPIGSIGPTRERCLALLKGKCAAAGIVL